MSRADRFDFTLDEETEKRLYDLLTDMDTRNTNRFWITDKRGYHAEYVKIIRCKDCKHYTGYECIRAKVSNIRVITDENEYCSRAERKEE